MRLCSVSVDLDEIACYSQIHGIPIEPLCSAVYDRAMPRIRDFAAGMALPLTLFVVAHDLERPQNTAALAQAVRDGHEIGNHSLDHWYDLTRRVRSEQAHQVLEASNRIHGALGVRPSGFRAPGYTVTDSLLSVVTDAGLSYDSSVFPCPAYYGAKATALLLTRLLRRQSSSILDDPSMLRAPTVPYRTGTPYWSRGAGILEIPIQVVGPLRLPFIGTSLTLLGPNGARRLTQGLLGQQNINLELHGLDFLDARDVPEPLLARQPDLRVPIDRKLQALAAALEVLRSNGFSFVRLDEAARTLTSGRS